MMNIESVLNNAGFLLTAYAQRRAKQAEKQKPVKLSVIIPVYNAMPYLPECMRSLLAQTLEDIELIVVDDGSTDGSGDLADALAEVYANVTVIRQKNAGVSTARNAGLDVAQGEYIGFVDADDFVAPDMYKDMFIAAERDNADVVSTWFKCVYSAGNNPADKEFLYKNQTLLNPEEIKAFLPAMNANHFFHFTWRNIFRRSVLKKENIRFDERITVGEDTLFNMQAILAGANMLMLPGTPYHYRIHPESCMGSGKYKPFLLQSLLNQYEEKLKVFNKYYCDDIIALLHNTAEHTLKTQVPFLLKNIYFNSALDHKTELKQIFVSKLVADAFEYYDINAFRSTSLDWLMLWFAKNNRFLPAHLVCKYILYKT